MQTIKEKLRSFGSGPDALEKRVTDVVERATSDMMINPDWGVNMELVDIVNTEPTVGCYERVFKALRRRLGKGNSKIQLLTLTLLETCVKNTGSEFHAALVKAEFWDEVVRLTEPRKKTDLQVQDKVLVLVEDCAHALTTPGYQLTYNSLKESGVRFPVRPAEEIGAGFSLPPTNRDANMMAGVSEEDQKAIQEALKDLGSAEPRAAPTAAPAPRTVATYAPAMDAGATDTEKLRTELRFVANSVELLKDALGSIPQNEPELVHQDYIKDLSQQCTETVPRLKKLIESASDEGLLAEALSLNDDLGAVLMRYEQMVKKAEDAKKPMPIPEEEPALMELHEPTLTTGVGQGSTSYMPPNNFAGTVPGAPAQLAAAQADPFDMLAAESGPQPPAPPPVPTTTTHPPVQLTPPPSGQPQSTAAQKKEQDPFEDLISF